MKLFKPKSQEMGEIHLAVSKQILSLIDPPISIASVLKNRPIHYVSSWRNVLFYVFNKHMGVNQSSIALWFKVNERTVWRGINLTKEVLSKESDEAWQLKEIIKKSIEKSFK
jgi:hypothetical protein